MPQFWQFKGGMASVSLSLYATARFARFPKLFFDTIGVRVMSTDRGGLD